MGKFLDSAELIAALDPLKTPEPGAGLGASVGKVLVAIVKHLSGRSAAAHAEHERKIESAVQLIADLDSRLTALERKR